MKLPHTVIIVALVVLSIVGAWYVYTATTSPAIPAREVLSFEACAQAGYPIMESFPRQCKTPDGRTYAEEPTQAQLDLQIAYSNATANDLVVTNPMSGSVTGKSFRVTGKARGTWYFEASFPIRILDANGAVIASGIAQAKEDWMTTEFVPFDVEIKVPDSYIGAATLVLQKDNPSGLTEKDASVSVPFTIEY